jgi:ribonuclease Y
MIIQSILAVLIGAAAGVGGSVVLLQKKGKSDEKALALAEKKAAQIVQQAEAEAAKRKAELLADLEQRQQFVRDLESSAKQRDGQLERRSGDLDQKIKQFETQQKELEEIKEAVRSVREKQEQSLAKIAGMTKDEARETLMQHVERSSKDELLRRMQSLDEMTDNELSAEAKKRLATVLARVASDFTVENTVFAVPIPNEEMKGRLIGKEGRNVQTFEKATGVDLLIDESPDSVLISSFDPMRREIGRVALEALVKDGRVNPAKIEEVVKKAEEDVQQAARKAGENAALEAKVPGLPKDVLKILGALKYRSSYGQNQLAHAVEVSKIAGILAEEIGADAQVVRKAGLLHDIGKALDHDIKAPHHHISADIAKRYNLGDDVVHAIIAHHDDVEPTTVEAWIVRTADAISGARPGARRVSYEEYVQRMRDLESAALSFAGVDKVFAIQAGREVRVFVRPGDVDDLAAAKLAKEIAAKIEGELSYPGQVRVNVIRETRAAAIAA